MRKILFVTLAVVISMAFSFISCRLGSDIDTLRYKAEHGGHGGKDEPIETEPDLEEWFKKATPLTENIWMDGMTGNSTTSSGGEWFSFTATANEQYIHVPSDTLDNFYMLVFNSSSAQVVETGAWWNNNYNYFTSFTVTPGQKYYIRVSPVNNFHGTFKIAFNTSMIPPGVTPTALTENIWANGNLSVSGGQWFSFTTTANEQYIHVSFGTLSSLYVQVYNLSGTVFNNSWLYNNGYTYLSLTPGQYYIRITNSSDTGTYSIAFNTSSTAPSSP